jgi:hypothetical protein
MHQTFFLAGPLAFYQRCWPGFQGPTLAWHARRRLWCHAGKPPVTLTIALGGCVIQKTLNYTYEWLAALPGV